MPSQQLVLGTAGHIDHGKTSLVRALTGLLAPFGTTILGMLAISDIRQSPSRIRGLGLVYLDTILFPILVLDVAILLPEVSFCLCFSTSGEQHSSLSFPPGHRSALC